MSRLLLQLILRVTLILLIKQHHIRPEHNSNVEHLNDLLFEWIWVVIPYGPSHYRKESASAPLVPDTATGAERNEGLDAWQLHTTQRGSASTTMYHIALQSLAYSCYLFLQVRLVIFSYLPRAMYSDLPPSRGNSGLHRTINSFPLCSWQRLYKSDRLTYSL